MDNYIEQTKEILRVLKVHLHERSQEENEVLIIDSLPLLLPPQRYGDIIEDLTSTYMGFYSSLLSSLRRFMPKYRESMDAKKVYRDMLCMGRIRTACITHYRILERVVEIDPRYIMASEYTMRFVEMLDGRLGDYKAGSAIDDLLQKLKLPRAELEKFRKHVLNAECLDSSSPYKVNRGDLSLDELNCGNWLNLWKKLIEIKSYNYMELECDVSECDKRTDYVAFECCGPVNSCLPCTENRFIQGNRQCLECGHLVKAWVPLLVVDTFFNMVQKARKKNEENESTLVLDKNMNFCMKDLE